MTVPPTQASLKNLELLRQDLLSHINEHHELPPFLKKYNVQFEYTVEKELNNKIFKILRRYRPDYASVVVVDNETGKVLALVDFSRKSGNQLGKLFLSRSNPAASLSKIVVAAELLENANVGPTQNFSYLGRATTLYKYQLRKPTQRNKRWTREISLIEAFSKSNNVVFAKAAMKYSSANDLLEMANRWGFNDRVTKFLPIEMSRFVKAENDYHLAELASGMNRETLITPLHAAFFPMVVVNEGLAKKIQLVEEVKKKGKSYWKAQEERPGRVISDQAATKLAGMMQKTVVKGTARKAFRRHRWRYRRLADRLEIGGKTGSITGGKPFGKRDWFVAYARPKSKNEKGVSISIMLINKKKWYIRSTELARQIIEIYYKDKI